ncbi:polyhydroxyalkanoic acid system family protein [Aurantiacibacter gilvus]|uniref:Polyhydroxyalkanoic acid system family protein n=1 Tax=Aurantiacibacter gilvus TaxID=3139141 RepID=A0ABU9IGY2_9SPHN
MQVAIPHNLDREEVRRRFRDNTHRIGDSIPGGMAEIETSWPSEDRMNMAIEAMGQALTGHIDIEDQQVVFHMTLPAALGFLTPMIEGAIRKQGQNLLEPPQS